MEIITIALLSIVAIAIIALIVVILRRERALLSSRNTQSQNDSFILLQNQIQNQMTELSRTLDARLDEVPKAIQAQFSESAKIIREVTGELTKVSEGQKQVVNLADQLRGLEDILKNPKQRGVLGEYFLETLLKNVLTPAQYKMQYMFSNGEIVDAVVFVKDKIIPIDSKFSLENYNRLMETRDPLEKERLEKLFVSDLKLRITETSKYIRPSEGTMDFAFMFIPHEAIYYDLLINKVGAISEDTENLIQRAAGKYKVIIVSPTSFLAYLQTVLQGLRALQIEESAKEIRRRVEELGRHLSNYEEYMKKLGGHLGTSVSMYNQAYKELGKVDKDVLRITGSGTGTESVSLTKPDLES